MLKTLLLSGLAATAITASAGPSLAQSQAQPQISCQSQKNGNRAIGTVLGAIGGALLGNAIGQGGGREGGTIIGGVGGAVAGNVVGGATVNCGSNQYGYYDDNGRWIPNNATQYGYYDPNGHWIDTSAQANDGPPPPPAYGQNGAYGPPQGGYGPPPAGSDQGGYAPPPPPPGAYDQSAAYGGGGYQGADRIDTRQREDWLQNKIQQRIADGAIGDRDGRRALRQLDEVRRMDADYRSADGHLTPDQRHDILARLDTLRANLALDGDQAYATGRN